MSWKSKEKQKEWRDSNPDKRRGYELTRHFWITLKQYNTLADGQGFACLICRSVVEDETGKAKTLHVDHCHKTNKVRGLLCNDCNVGLGCFHDSLGRLRAAIQYLLDRG